MAPVRRFCLYGARRIFMRKDHLFTALTAALLLAASAGTASAQSPRIGFTPRSGSVNEGARADANSEHPLLTVTVRAWNLPAGPAGQGAGRSADRAPAGHRRARRDHHRDRGHRPPRGRHRFSAVRHPRGPRRRRGIRRERYLPADRRPRAGRRLAERRVLPAAAVDRVHRYRRPLPGDGHRRRPAGDGDVQPHRHQDLRGERGAAQRPRRRPGGRELSHAGGRPEYCPERYSRRRGRRCRMPDGPRIPLCPAHLVRDGDGDFGTRAG